MTQIAPESKKFLMLLFSDLRGDLEEGQPGTVEKAAIYDVLLDALSSERFPDDEKLRASVADIAKATDEGNEYERGVLEHQALEELGKALQGCP